MEVPTLALHQNNITKLMIYKNVLINRNESLLLNFEPLTKLMVVGVDGQAFSWFGVVEITVGAVDCPAAVSPGL